MEIEFLTNEVREERRVTMDVVYCFSIGVFESLCYRVSGQAVRASEDVFVELVVVFEVFFEEVKGKCLVAVASWDEVDDVVVHQIDDDTIRFGFLLTGVRFNNIADLDEDCFGGFGVWIVEFCIKGVVWVTECGDWVWCEEAVDVVVLCHGVVNYTAILF